MCFGGGGGGSAQRDLDPVERESISNQTRIATDMANVGIPAAKTGMANLETIANQDMDGTTASRLRGIAGADAGQALGQGLSAAQRTLSRTGGDQNKFAHDAVLAGIDGAKMKVGAMNTATVGAEDLKRNSNQNLVSLGTGQGSVASNTFGTVAGQLGQNRQANNASNASSAQGLGMAGAYLANGLRSNNNTPTPGLADGGYISKLVAEGKRDLRHSEKETKRERQHRKHEKRFASGGMAGLQRFNPGAPKMYDAIDTSGAGSNNKGMSTMQQVGAVAQPIVMMAGADMAKDGIKSGFSAAKNALFAPSAAQTEAVKSAIANAGTEGIQTGAMSTAAPAAASVAPTASAPLMAELASDAVIPAATETAGLTAAEVLPLLLAKDGAYVGLRKNMMHGGDVDGPGTETSDSIPARLSDGEYVLNAEAVKMIGKKKLDQWNDAGLSKRRGLSAAAC